MHEFLIIDFILKLMHKLPSDCDISNEYIFLISDHHLERDTKANKHNKHAPQLIIFLTSSSISRFFAMRLDSAVNTVVFET